MRNLPTEILGILNDVVGQGSSQLHEPVFTGNEKKYLFECIDSTYVSSVGKFVDELEGGIARYTGARYAIATSSGTTALQIALLVAGVARDHEVIVPSLTFVATANAVSHVSAIPHFVDSSKNDFGIEPEALRDWLKFTTEKRGGFCVNKNTGRRISAIVPVHVFGHPCSLDALLSICAEFDLVMVEDAAESLGSWYDGRHTGTVGTIGVISFNGNKTITTGSGGAILTNDEEIGKRARHMVTTARRTGSKVWEYDHDEIGFNFRMSNLNAAVGCAQLENLPQILRSKRALFEKYRKAFACLPNIDLVEEPAKCTSNYWLQTIRFGSGAKDQLQDVLEVTNRMGMMTRPVWKLLHRSTPYRDCPSASIVNSKEIEECHINIPSSPFLA